MLIKRQVGLFKIETTYNTDPTPSNTVDAFLMMNVSYAPANQRMYVREDVRPSLAMLQQIYGGSLFEMTFDVHVKGSGTAGTAPEFGSLLRACGMGETISASTSVAYAPVSTGHESGTMYIYEDGVLYKATGCRGNVSFSEKAGEPAKLSFTMTGHLVGSFTDVALPTPTLDSTNPIAVLSAGFSVGGYSAIISTFSFDLTNTISTPDNINASDGYGEIIITGRDVNGTFDPENVLAATNNFLSNWQSGTSGVLAHNTIGATSGNIFDVAMPVMAYRDWATGDRDGIRTLEIPFGAHESSGDDEVTITFT